MNSMPRQVLRRGELVASVTDLFVGNSTMEAGLDENALLRLAPDTKL